MGRSPCCDKANVKRGPWSPEEDAKLKAYIEAKGTGGNWISLPHKIGLKRCGKSCRLRWLNYLRPNIRHGGFTEEEENIICNLYITIGSRWSIIAAQLPGRTDNDIKNYWNTKLKKKLMAKQKKDQQEACQLLEQEIKTDAENFLFNQTLNLAPYWINPQTSIPTMIPLQEAHFEIQDQFTRLLMNNSQNPNLEQLNVGDHITQASNMDYGVPINNMYQGVECFPLESEAILNDQLRFNEGNESYSAVVDVGSSSTITSNSGGSISLDDMSNSLVNTPISSFDVYQSEVVVQAL